ncbi:MAG TPA: beta/gamma crystallin-related protein, partial [Chitinophagaceae bacterium]|nr:beta/gamma crystallin-related protein [Chitinophagaceae bacterium]
MPHKLFLSIFLFGFFAASAQNYVTLHEDCNYAGKQYYLEPGTYKRYQMKIDNDQLSSMQIPSGMKVTIYTDDDFQGNSKTFTGNISCLEAAWNDQASSFVVEGNNYQPGYNQNDYVVFYNDCYSKGDSKTLKPGTYTATELGIFNQNISSFAIYGNLRVRAYITSDNASGYFGTFDASQSTAHWQKRYWP